MTGSTASPQLSVSVLTPPGRAAVATVAVAGEGCVDLVLRFFAPMSKRLGQALPVGRVLFGHWRNPQGAEDGEGVVVCRRSGNNVEVNCHGGTAAVEAIVQSLVEEGAGRVHWREWPFRPTNDEIQFEAATALCQAKTTKTAAILLDQYRGALAGALRQIEADIRAGRGDEAKRTLHILRGRAKIGRRLVEPFRVAIVGRPNVGKSSLLNALLGYTRAIVFDQPGTTRDVVTAVTAFDGWPVELADTAGLREAFEDIEREGVDRARRQAAAADLTMLIFDSHEGWTNEDELIHNHCRQALVVANKSDLASTEKPAPEAISVSAETKQGLDRLIQQVVDRLIVDAPPAGAAVPFCDRHDRLIDDLLARL